MESTQVSRWCLNFRVQAQIRPQLITGHGRASRLSGLRRSDVHGFHYGQLSGLVGDRVILARLWLSILKL